MTRNELYDEYGVTCFECFAIVKHHVKVDDVLYCEDHAPDDFTEETWLLFDAEDDEDASHEANVTQTDRGYRVGWSNTAVGLVTDVDFDTLEAAHKFLEDAGYADFTA